MYQISNDDFARVLRLLKSLSVSVGTTAREWEERRQARLLVRRFEKKRQKRRITGDKEDG